MSGTIGEPRESESGGHSSIPLPQGKDAFGHTFKVQPGGEIMVPLAIMASSESSSPKDLEFSYLKIETNKIDSLIALGCPEEDAHILSGKGYLEAYQENLIHYPPSVALALLTLVISQDPDISTTLLEKIRPKLTETGCSGVYFLKDFSGKTTHVYKPEDEEMYMPACPRAIPEGYERPPESEYPVRLSIAKGWGAKNEVAAAKIGQQLGLDVPACYYVSPPVKVTDSGRLSNASGTRVVKKPGSLQEFVEGDLFGTRIRGQGPMAPMKILQRLYGDPAESLQVVERMVLMDILLGNADRHVNNLIVDVKGRRLYPIDHGLTFPDGMSLEALTRREAIVNETRCWSGPTDEEISDATKTLFAGLDLDDMAVFIRSQGLKESSIEEMLLRGHFLKIGLEHGASLNTLVTYCNEDREGESQLLATAYDAIRSLGVTATSLKALSEKERRTLFGPYLEAFKAKTEALYV